MGAGIELQHLCVASERSTVTVSVGACIETLSRRPRSSLARSWVPLGKPHVHVSGVRSDFCGWHRLELVFLPPYASEFNPDEYLNRDLKTALRNGPVSRDKTSLLEKAKAFMNALSTLPEHIMGYFRHPAAQYANHPI